MVETSNIKLQHTRHSNSSHFSIHYYLCQFHFSFTSVSLQFHFSVLPLSHGFLFTPLQTSEIASDRLFCTSIICFNHSLLIEITQIDKVQKQCKHTKQTNKHKCTIKQHRGILDNVHIATICVKCSIKIY